MASDYTYSFNGLSFGDGTDIFVEEIRGLEGAVVDLQTERFARAIGGVPGESYLVPRTIEFVLEVAKSTSTALEDAVDDVVEAFASNQTTDEKALLLKHPGAGQRRIEARTRTLSVDPRNVTSDVSYTRRATVRLVASDPVVYDATATETTVSVFAGGGGLTYTVTYPKIYTAGGSGNEITVTNSGDWFTWAEFQVEASGGDVATPIIENVTDGWELAFTANGGATVADGQTLIVKTHPLTRSAKIGSASRVGKLSNASQWKPLSAGATKFRFRATGDTSSGTLTITLRSAWMRG